MGYHGQRWNTMGCAGQIMGNQWIPGIPWPFSHLPQRLRGIPEQNARWSACLDSSVGFVFLLFSSWPKQNRRGHQSGRVRTAVSPRWAGAWGRSRWPVSRVLSPAPYPCGRRSGDGHSSGTTVARRLARPTRAAGGNARRPMVSHGAGPPLFGLAPGGVCRATTVTGRAVRSYRTLSPLPGIRRTEARAVCFLLHCPWGRPRRALPGTVFPWSPDFPPRRAEARQSGHPAICCAACIGTGRADRKPIRPDSRRDVIR